MDETNLNEANISLELPPPPNEIEISEEEVTDDVVVNIEDAVKSPIEKAGKYRGFQGRAKRKGSAYSAEHRWSESQYSIYKQLFLIDFIAAQSEAWHNSAPPDDARTTTDVEEDFNPFIDTPTPPSYPPGMLDRIYTFVDMFGGLGMWADKHTGQTCAGSPICIYNTLEEYRVEYYGMVFEQNRKRADDLKNILYNRRQRVDVFNEDNRHFCKEYNDRLQPNQISWASPSLLYLDYTRQANSTHIRELTTSMPQSDVLIHYNAGAFKRAINSPLCDKQKAHEGNAQYLTYLFNRKYWFINNWDILPHNKCNFVAIYGTNKSPDSILTPENYARLTNNAAPRSEPNILYPYDSIRGRSLRLKAHLSKEQMKTTQY